MDREQVRETDSGGSRQHSSRAGAGRIPEEAEAVLQYASREGAAEAGLGLAAGPALPYGPGLAPPAAEADCCALAPGAALSDAAARGQGLRTQDRPRGMTASAAQPRETERCGLGRRIRHRQLTTKRGKAGKRAASKGCHSCAWQRV